MNIEKLNDYAVKIFLSADDLDIYGICFQQMDSRSTADLILALSDEIFMVSGIDLSGKKLIAEVFQQRSGCTIFISFNPYRSNIPYQKLQLTTELTKFGQLKEFCRFLQKTPEFHIRSSSLYLNGGFLYLIVLCDTKSAGSLCIKAGKYGRAEFCSDISEAAIKEHFQCIEEEFAVRKIAVI